MEETSDTLTGNARLKAHAAVTATGEAAIADDSGLFVDALGGAPGVHSARHAGPGASYADNVEKLLTALRDVSFEERGARFRTIAVLMRPDGETRVFEGNLEGRILEAPRGREGFGYDPVFVPGGQEQTLAEMPLARKNRLSHRALAFTGAAAFLVAHPGWLATGGCE
ncbi:N/A [soil metagenome]